MEEKMINVSLKGTFTFEICQGNLDINNPKELKYAIEDFKVELESAMESCGDGIEIVYDYDENDIKVK